MRTRKKSLLTLQKHVESNDRHDLHTLQEAEKLATEAEQVVIELEKN